MAFFFLFSGDVQSNGYIMSEFLVDLMPSFIPHEQVKEMRVPSNGLHRFLAEF